MAYCVFVVGICLWGGLTLLVNHWENKASLANQTEKLGEIAICTAKHKRSYWHYRPLIPFPANLFMPINRKCLLSSNIFSFCRPATVSTKNRKSTQRSSKSDLVGFHCMKIILYLTYEKRGEFSIVPWTDVFTALFDMRQGDSKIAAASWGLWNGYRATTAQRLVRYKYVGSKP